VCGGGVTGGGRSGIRKRSIAYRLWIRGTSLMCYIDMQESDWLRNRMAGVLGMDGG
jgi:hypothetical protein